MSLSLDSSRFNRWLDREQFINGIYARPNNPHALYTEFQEAYRPGKTFEIPIYSLSKDKCRVFTSGYADPHITALYQSAENVHFPVHPQNFSNPEIPLIKTFEDLKPRQQTVTATSSTRTVFVLDKTSPAHCIKPHTSCVITKWLRHMKERKVKHAIAVTKIFEKASTFKHNPKLAFFPESYGATIGEGMEAWGFLIREMRSKPHDDFSGELVPLCSMYCPDKRNDDAKPLLIEYIKRSRLDPKEYLLDRIFKPLLDGWAKIYLETGVLLEPHGQNVCIEMSETGIPHRFVHRDFDAPVNTAIAPKDLQADLNPNDVFINEDAEGTPPQGSYVSAYFDQSMQVPLNKMAEIAQAQFGIEPAALQKGVCDYLSIEHPDLLHHFPKDGKVYNYSKEGKKVRLVEAKTPASSWRINNKTCESGKTECT